MALPEENFCISLDIDVDLLASLGIVLPGGAELRAMFEVGTIPSASELVSQLMGQVNVALTPLIPIFRLIDVCLQIVKCVNSIQEALLPPDPTNPIRCLAKLAVKISFLLQLIPQLNIPFFIKDILGILIIMLSELKTQLELQIEIQTSIDLGQARAIELGASGMVDSLNCAQANLDLQFSSATAGMQPIAIFIAILNLLLEIAGMDPIDFNGDLGVDPSDSLAPLQAIIDALQVIYDGLPDRIGT